MNYQTDKSLIGQFQEFDDYRDADDAVYDLNGKDLHGSRCVLIKKYFLEDQFSKNCNWCFAFRVVVEHARGPRRDRGRDRRRPWVDKYGPPTRTDYRLIIENLSTRVSWQDLKDLMRRAGEVTYANAHNDNRNEGYIFAICTSYFDSIFSKLLRFFFSFQCG